MKLEVEGHNPPLRGNARVPGDKSIGHRALLLASLARGQSRIAGLSDGEDNRRTLAAMRGFGVAMRQQDGAWIVTGAGLDGIRSVPGGAPVDCGNSGTTMRLLAGLLAPCEFATRLVGDRYLEARPMARLADPLCKMGAALAGRSVPDRPGELFAPLVVGPARARLCGIRFAAPRPSAQVKSAILLAALSADGVTEICESVLSRDHSERMLRSQGAPLTVSPTSGGTRIILDPAGWSRELAPLDLVVPGDLSSAAFLLGAAAIVPGSEVTVHQVGLNPTRSGVLDALRAMGAELQVELQGEVAGEPVGDVTLRQAPLAAMRIDGELAVRALDELPLLAAVAAHAAGTTVIADAAELRVKESDRIAAMVAALRALGVEAEERSDGMAITGASGRPRAGVVESRGDHRIAMAAAVCALTAGGPTRILDADNVATSFPAFIETMRELGANVAAG